MVIYHSDGMIFFVNWSSYTPAVVWVGGSGSVVMRRLLRILHLFMTYVLAGEQGLPNLSRRRSRFAITHLLQ